MSDQTEEKDLLSIGALDNHHFHVPNYQRGYKWQIIQVHELLDDILEFMDKNPNDGFYCLQPVVVKELYGDNRYELIDGQQRLTTIYIINKILNSKTTYTISYETRSSSKDFLDKIENISDSGLNYEDFEIIEDKNVRKWKDSVLSKVNENWRKYSGKNSDLDNVDNYHFFCTYQYAKKWLDDLKEKNKGKQNGQNEYEKFIETLRKRTKVIWYEPLKDNDDVEEETVFDNLNRGKIPLDQAELIKALFVIKLKELGNPVIISKFSSEWNQIETKLQDDNFWYFIFSKKTNSFQYNRISFLFDIHNDTIEANDSFSSYYVYLQKYKNTSNSYDWEQEWEDVKNKLSIIEEWYNDRELYHLIGYILYHPKIKSLKDVLKIYREESKSKDEFIQGMKQLIKNNLYDNFESTSAGKQKIEEFIDSLSYEDDKENILKVLILHNIITYEKLDTVYRLSFSELKKTRNSTSWSIEHIHAQNTDKLTINKIEEIKNWINDLSKLISDLKNKKKNQNKEIKEVEDNITKLNNHIQQIKQGGKVDENKFNELVKNLVENTDELLDKHKMSNLCLLDKSTNSMLSNGFYPAKKELINNLSVMSLDEINKMREGKNLSPIKRKPYIPIVTQNVFTKFYTKPDSGNDNTQVIQYTFWGAKDREEYLKNIKSYLNEYLN